MEIRLYRICCLTTQGAKESAAVVASCRRQCSKHRRCKLAFKEYKFINRHFRRSDVDVDVLQNVVVVGYVYLSVKSCPI